MQRSESKSVSKVSWSAGGASSTDDGNMLCYDNTAKGEISSLSGEDKREDDNSSGSNSNNNTSNHAGSSGDGAADEPEDASIFTYTIDIHLISNVELFNRCGV